MPRVYGTLTDFGLAPLNGHAPKISFIPASVGLAGMNLLSRKPVKSAPAANGYWEAELASTNTIAPATHYMVQIEWTETKPRKDRVEVLPWKLFVPPEGGALADMLRVPANPALVWTGPTPPKNPSNGLWWLDPATGDLSEYSQPDTKWMHKAALRGPAGYNATGAVQDLATLADYVNQTAGPNPFAGALAESTNILTATPARFPGLDPTGTANSAPALQRAALATPDGGTLVIPAGRYRCAGSAIDLSGLKAKNITVDARAATFIKASDSPVMHFEGGFDVPLAVTATGPATVSDDTSATNPGTKLTLSTAPPASWTRGTLIKLVADDVIPGGRPGKTAGEEARIGQYLVVSSVAGNVVTCLGTLRESYRLNVRVARQRPPVAHVIGGTFDTDPAGMDGTWTSGHVMFRGMNGATFRDYNVLASPGPAVVYRGCYGYADTNGRIGYSKNNGTTGNNGYGIMDTSSSFGNISGYRANRVRHAYTDGTAFIPAGSANIENYGGTYGTLVHGGRAYGTANVAWDTHSWSENVTFSDCEAVDSYKAVSLRGRKHRVTNCSAIRCYFGGLSIYNEDDGGTSWGHTVKGFTADGVHRRAVEVLLNGDAHPSANQRETRKSYIDGVVIKNGTVNSVFVRNGDVRVDNLLFVAGPELEAGQPLAYVRNARVEGTGWVQDMREVETGSGHALIRLEAGAALALGKWDYLTTAANAGKVTYGIYSTGAENSATVDKLTMSHAGTAVPYNSLAEGSKVDWEYLNDGQNSAWVPSSGDSIADAGLFGAAVGISRSRAPEIVARLNPTGGSKTLAALKPGAFRGQRLRIWNYHGSNSVTVRHGSTEFLTFLKSGAALSLAPNQQILLVWHGTTWWEI